MAENVPVDGFNIPPAGGSQLGSPDRLAPDQQKPGFVPPAPANQSGTFTQADIDKAVAAAKAAPPAPQAPVTQGANLQAPTEGTDKVLDSLTQSVMAMAQGLDLDRAIGKALQFGNPALIDKAYIAEKGGSNAAHIQTLADAIVQRVQAQTESTTSAVFAEAGGKDQWSTAAAMFDKSAPAHLKQVIVAMLESGDPAAIRAGAKTVVEYSKANGLVVTPAQLLNSGAAAAGSSTALSKQEFQAAKFKLNPNSQSYNTDVAALVAGRRLGMQLGK